MTHNYRYQVLNPRSTNNMIRPKTLGIEVTIPALADQCDLGNIDPQHSGSLGDWQPVPYEDFRGADALNRNPPRTAIEASIAYPLPEPDTTLATVRPDLDSIGAMAIFYIRQHRLNLDESITECKPLCDRVRAIAMADSFDRGAWPGPRPMPGRELIWPNDVDGGGLDDTRFLAAISAAVQDSSKPLQWRVELMAQWLLFGEEKKGIPAFKEYRRRVDQERLDMIKAIEDGSIVVSDKRGVAIVESTHRAAIWLGYHLCPVVVAINPAFQFQGGEPHRKVTIAQYDERYIDLQGVLSELSTLESGWGGSDTIGGSPQGISTELPENIITKCISKYWRYCSLCKDLDDIRHNRLCSLDLYGGNYSPANCALTHMSARDGAYRQRWFVKSPSASSVIEANLLPIQEWVRQGNKLDDAVVYSLCSAKWNPGVKVDKIVCGRCSSFSDGNHCGLTGEAATSIDLICDDFDEA